MQKTTTFLMFSGDQYGKAAEAMTLYTSLFKNSGIKQVERYKTDEPGGKTGDVKLARFTLNGIEYMAVDNAAGHNFNFTPSISIFVNCENEEELDVIFGKLSPEGTVMMPPDNYGFSKKFTWIADKYGVSWQLNVAA